MNFLIQNFGEFRILIEVGSVDFFLAVDSELHGRALDGALVDQELLKISSSARPYLREGSAVHFALL